MNMRGFTLIEITIVLALVGLIAALALPVSLGSYRRYIAASGRDDLLTLLRHARAQAMAGVCEGDACTGAAAHGVAIEDGAYVLFQGETYATRDPDQDIAFDTDGTAYSSGLREVVFEPLSGDVLHPGQITIEENGKAAMITIGDQGQIDESD